MIQKRARSHKQWSVIFDHGGVLVTTVDYGPRHAWDKRLNLPLGTVESIVHGIPAWREAQCGQITLEAYWQKVGAELHLTPEQLIRLRNDFYSGDQLNKDLVTLIRELRHNKIQIGLMSNNSLDLVDALSSLGINSLFDACVISAEIGVMKPAARAYQAILEKMQIEAKDAIFIDDFIENVDGAQVVGMQAIHFTPSLDLREILKEKYGILESDNF